MKDLDFLKPKVDLPDMHNEFLRIASRLFGMIIKSDYSGGDYNITAMEFYYYSSTHKDFFTYKLKEQSQFGSFVRHGSGLDLTFGDSSRGTYGGILLQGIKKVKTDEFIKGPWNVRLELTNKSQKGYVSLTVSKVTSLISICLQK